MSSPSLRSPASVRFCLSTAPGPIAFVDIAGGTYWHTNRKFRGTDADRGDIVEMVETVTRASERKVVAVKLPSAGPSRKDLAQARAMCLDRLVRSLVSGSGAISRHVVLAHGRMTDEPLLWAADTLSWVLPHSPGGRPLRGRPLRGRGFLRQIRALREQARRRIGR